MDEPLALEVAHQFSQRIRRDRLALGGAHVFEPLWRLLELRIEIADTEPRQGCLNAVDDRGLLSNEHLPLAVGALGILLRKRWNRCHLAVLPLAAQPTEKGAFQALGVQSVGLRTSVLPRHRHARSMNDVRFDVACPQPAGQPKAVAARLKGYGNAVDLVSRFLGFRSPPFEQL